MIIKNKAKELLIKIKDVDSGKEKYTTIDRVWSEIREFLEEISDDRGNLKQTPQAKRCIKNP